MTTYKRHTHRLRLRRGHDEPDTAFDRAHALATASALNHRQFKARPQKALAVPCAEPGHRWHVAIGTKYLRRL